MERGEVGLLIRGELPELAAAECSGYGYGYGYGDGNGDGSGYGYGNGNGSGYGYGSGYGDGDGYGYGYGAGYGYGNGSGYGYGDGYGNGSGYGSGSGYGNGAGYGYGYGYGDGDGDGSGYHRALFESSKSSWPDSILARLAQCELEANTLAFWKSGKDGLPSNGGKSKEPAFIGKKEEIKGPLEICTKNALHATMNPDKWQGDRLWVVALFGEVQWQDDKCAALKREIIAEIKI